MSDVRERQGGREPTVTKGRETFGKGGREGGLALEGTERKGEVDGEVEKRCSENLTIEK